MHLGWVRTIPGGMCKHISQMEWREVDETASTLESFRRDGRWIMRKIAVYHRYLIYLFLSIYKTLDGFHACVGRRKECDKKVGQLSALLSACAVLIPLGQVCSGCSLARNWLLSDDHCWMRSGPLKISVEAEIS